MQFYNFYKDIKEKGTSKVVIYEKSIEEILNEAREVNKNYSEIPESEKLKPQVNIFSREECIFNYCPNPNVCQNNCINKNTNFKS